MSHDFANQSLIDNLEKYRGNIKQSLDYEIGYAEGLRDGKEITEIDNSKPYTYNDIKNKYIGILMETSDKEMIALALHVIKTMESIE